MKSKPAAHRPDSFGCLDFVEAVNRHRIYPLMFCQLELEGHLDPERLRAAIQRSAQYVPEVLCSCDFKRGCFNDTGLTAQDTILFNNGISSWDISRRPQLQISIQQGLKNDTVLIGMSHILTDGSGFLQYLYLLASLYNERFHPLPLINVRDPSAVLKNMRIQRRSEQTIKGQRKHVSPLRPYGKGTHPFCLTSQISADDFSLLHAKVQKSRATLNDAFLTAYARVIAANQSTDAVILPCPADLRRFNPIPSDRLSVANMTGIYRKVVIEIEPHHSFSDTLAQVHIEMELQKSRRRCFSGISLLNRTFHKIPRPLLEQAIKATYRLSPVSYTNIGQIDEQKLFFYDCRVKDCFMTGAYRLAPDFQLNVSTFRNVCTLSCRMMGQPGDDVIGQSILDQVKKELSEWASAPHPLKKL